MQTTIVSQPSPSFILDEQVDCTFSTHFLEYRLLNLPINNHQQMIRAFNGVASSDMRFFVEGNLACRLIKEVLKVWEVSPVEDNFRIAGARAGSPLIKLAAVFHHEGFRRKDLIFQSNQLMRNEFTTALSKFKLLLLFVRHGFKVVDKVTRERRGFDRHMGFLIVFKCSTEPTFLLEAVDVITRTTYLIEEMSVQQMQPNISYGFWSPVSAANAFFEG